MSFSGSCHCGKVAFTCDDEVPGKAMTCNCSICRRKGSVLHFTPEANFHLTAEEGVLKSYEFNRHVIRHYFCANCGIGPFGKAVSPEGVPTVAINLRCADVPLEEIETSMYDGASL